MSCHGGGNSLDSRDENDGQTPSMEDDAKSFDPHLPIIDSETADCGIQSPPLSLGGTADHQSTTMMQVKLPPRRPPTVQTQKSLPSFSSVDRQSFQRGYSVPPDSAYSIKKVKPGEYMILLCTCTADKIHV